MEQTWPELAKISFDWIITFIGNDEWKKRQENIQKHLLEGSKKECQDVMGLYLYTIEQSIKYSSCHDPILVARLYPFFIKIGRNINEFKKVNGMVDKVKEIVKPSKANPIPKMYEIVVAISYMEKQWNIEFIPEKINKKTPDIKISKGDKLFFLECKFLIKDFPYKLNEKKCFKERWNLAVYELGDAIDGLKFDIRFKIPIEDTEENCIMESIKKIIYPARGVMCQHISGHIFN